MHSSIPETGVNALAELVEELKANAEVVREFPGFFELMKRIKHSDIQESIGFPADEIDCKEGCKTIVVPVGCQIKGDELILMLNVRLCVHSTSAMMSKILMHICRTYDANCYLRELKLPAYVPADSAYIQKMLESYKEVLGIETVPNVAMGVGYNSMLPNCVIFGPRFAVEHDEEDCCHAVDESRKISDLMKFTEMLMNYLQKVLAK